MITGFIYRPASSPSGAYAENVYFHEGVWYSNFLSYELEDGFGAAIYPPEDCEDAPIPDEDIPLIRGAAQEAREAYWLASGTPVQEIWEDVYTGRSFPNSREQLVEDLSTKKVYCLFVSPPALGDVNLNWLKDNSSLIDLSNLPELPPNYRWDIRWDEVNEQYPFRFGYLQEQEKVLVKA